MIAYDWPKHKPRNKTKNTADVFGYGIKIIHLEYDSITDSILGLVLMLFQGIMSQYQY